MCPGGATFKTQGGRGGVGGVAYKDWARLPPLRVCVLWGLGAGGRKGHGGFSNVFLTKKIVDWKCWWARIWLCFVEKCLQTAALVGGAWGGGEGSGHTHGVVGDVERVLEVVLGKLALRPDVQQQDPQTGPRARGSVR